MAYVWLYCVLLSNTLYFLAAEESCTKTLSLCKLKIGGDSPIQLPSKGPKGETGDFGDHGKNGDAGDPGPRGPNGDNGIPGVNGIPGSQGPKGFKGSSGDQGPIGDPGVSGSKGRTGKHGARGSRGAAGLDGSPGTKGIDGIPGLRGPEGPAGNIPEEGDKGLPGPIGPPGEKGSIGKCLCPLEQDESEDEDIFTEENPGNEPCKYSTDLLDKTKNYFLGPGPIKVRCIPRGDLTMVTCIPAKNSSVKQIDGEKHWLSQNNLTIEEIYGINRTQLEWLQRNSVSAYQTIRYHCLNSNPFPREKVENSLLLLTWNDNTIGPMPTLTKPTFYSVPLETDKCSNAADDTWSSTDIQLVSESIQRVPIIDFFIRDIRPGKTQAVKIEHYELCFD